MRTSLTVAISVIAGIGIGALGVGALHAQNKAPVYAIVETDVTNVEGYTKEFSPKAQALSKKSGARLLAVTMKIQGFEGTPPKRVALQQWDSVEKAAAWFNGAEYQQIREIGNKYAKFRIFALEGLPQP
jgi:uncharacterized protein (DUF1330 family)